MPTALPGNTVISSLEGLPTELRVLILWQVPVIEDLKSLVLASPNYHQSYLTVRQEILEGLVRHQYGDGENLDLAEALTAVRSKGVHFTDKREAAIALLDSWRRRHEIRKLSHPSPSRLDKVENIEEAIELLRLHKKLSFFFHDYSINVPKPPNVPASQWESEYLPLKFSALERRRIWRALYRLQIMKNIFGDEVHCLKRNLCEICGRRPTWQRGETTEPLWNPPPDIDLNALEESAYRLFYGTMPPWEYEEMGCVFTYLRTKVDVVLEEIADEFRQLMKDKPDRPGWFHDVLPKEERPPEALGVDQLEDLPRMAKNHSNGIAGLGPEFLFRILHMHGLTRRNLVITNFRGFWSGPWIGLWLDVPFEDRFPFTEPADQYDIPEFESFWSTLSPIEQPTIGWKKAWILPHDEYDDLEESMNVRKSEEDWDWGYALWDQERLREWKAPFVEDDTEAREESPCQPATTHPS